MSNIEDVAFALCKNLPVPLTYKTVNGEIVVSHPDMFDEDGEKIKDGRYITMKGSRFVVVSKEGKLITGNKGEED